MPLMAGSPCRVRSVVSDEADRDVDGNVDVMWDCHLEVGSSRRVPEQALIIAREAASLGMLGCRHPDVVELGDIPRVTSAFDLFRVSLG